MIDDKKVEECAELYADKVDDGSRTARQCAILAYREGCSQAIGLAWHDIGELPAAKNAVIVGMTKTKKKLKQFAFTSEDAFHKMVRSYHFSKWAYKEDIIGLITEKKDMEGRGNE